MCVAARVLGAYCPCASMRAGCLLHACLVRAACVLGGTPSLTAFVSLQADTDELDMSVGSNKELLLVKSVSTSSSPPENGEYQLLILGECGEYLLLVHVQR